MSAVPLARQLGLRNVRPSHFQLVKAERLASEVLARREEFVEQLSENPDEEAMKAILAEVSDVVSVGQAIPEEAGVERQMAEQIARSHPPKAAGRLTATALPSPSMAEAGDRLGATTGLGCSIALHRLKARKR
jgi:hypothetical protein